MKSELRSEGNKSIWRLISYDVWGNAKDGYEVNQAFYTNDYVELPENPSNTEIVRALKHIGWIKAGLHVESVGIEWSGENVIYISDSRQGHGNRPEFELARCMGVS